MSTRVRIQQTEGLLELVLCSEERGNALDLRTAEELAEAAQAIEGSGVRSVLLRAEGRNFCVGGDLRDFAGRGDSTGDHLRAVAGAAHRAVSALAEARVPVVSAVQGAAAGAGIGLALTADVVVAADTAKFRVAYTAIELSPDCGGSWFLPRVLGLGRALDLALTNRVLAAAEARDWGLVARVCPAEQLEDEARKLAIALGGPAATETKRLIRAAAGRDLGAHLDDEAATIAALGGRNEAQEAIQAFVR